MIKYFIISIYIFIVVCITLLIQCLIIKLNNKFQKIKCVKKTERKYKLTKEFIKVNGHKLYRIRALRDFGNIKKGDLGGYIETESNLSHMYDCWVENQACVYDNAEIYGDALISNYAQVYNEAKVSGYAKVFGSVKIYGNARISGDAEISDKARIYDNAEVYGYAKVYGYAEIYGDAEIYNNAQIYGESQIFGRAKVSNTAKVYGHAYISGNAEIHGDSWGISPFYLTLSQHSITSSSFTDLSIGYETHSIKYWKKNFEKIGKKYEYSDSEIELYVDSILMAEKYIEIAKKCYNI